MCLHGRLLAVAGVSMSVEHQPGLNPDGLNKRMWRALERVCGCYAHNVTKQAESD